MEFPNIQLFELSIELIVFHTQIGPTIDDTPIEIPIEYQIQTIS